MWMPHRFVHPVEAQPGVDREAVHPPLVLDEEAEIRIQLVERVDGRRELRQAARDADREDVRHRQAIHLPGRAVV